MANFYGLIKFKNEPAQFSKFPNYETGFDFIISELSVNRDEVVSASLYKTDRLCEDSKDLLWLSITAKEIELLVSFDNFFIDER